MSKEIAKETQNDIEYFKIAHFIYYLLFIHPKTKEADGIIYPSVAAEGEGFNMALKPESVDKKIKFNSASLCYLVKEGQDAHLIIKNHSIGQNPDGSLKYKNRDNFDEKSLKGLKFIN